MEKRRTYTEFGQVFSELLRARGISQGRMGSAISEPKGGNYYDSTGVRHLMTGTRKVTPALLEKVIAAFADLDAPLDAGEQARLWHAAGYWPPGLDVEDVIALQRDRSAAASTANDGLCGLFNTPRSRPVPSAPCALVPALVPGLVPAPPAAPLALPLAPALALALSLSPAA